MSDRRSEKWTDFNGHSWEKGGILASSSPVEHMVSHSPTTLFEESVLKSGKLLGKAD